MQNVSLLLDICRQSIFFHSVTDIAACLRAISDDPDVVLARIKNRYDPESDASSSAGYRNLAVNLRLDTPETRALGVETHVCEVQLLHLRMAVIKVIILFMQSIKVYLLYTHIQNLLVKTASHFMEEHSGNF
jgi:hypothetical protein